VYNTRQHTHDIEDLYMDTLAEESSSLLRPDYDLLVKGKRLRGYEFAKLFAGQHTLCVDVTPEFQTAVKDIYALLEAGKLSFKGFVVIPVEGRHEDKRKITFEGMPKKEHYLDPLTVDEKVLVLRRIPIKIDEIYEVYVKRELCLPKGCQIKMDELYGVKADIPELSARETVKVVKMNEVAQRNVEAKKVFSSICLLVKLDFPHLKKGGLLKKIKKHPSFKKVMVSRDNGFKDATLVGWLRKQEEFSRL
jgi:hypothetical protein